MPTVRTFNPNPHDHLELRRALQMLWVQVPPSTYDQTTAPASADDITKGWRIGSRWTDASKNNIYECADNTENAAVWNMMVDQTRGDGATASPAKGTILAYNNATGKWAPLSLGNNAEVLTVDSSETLGLKYAVPTVGDVVGPGSATDGGIALYDGVTGKLIKDGPFRVAGDGSLICTGSDMVFYVNNAGDKVAEFGHVGSHGNYLDLITNTGDISIGVNGAPADLNILLVPKGSGTVQYGGSEVGDVRGPAGGTANTEIAVFADATGKVIKRGPLKVTAGGNLDRAASTFTIYLNSNELLKLRASSGVDFFAIRDGNGQASIEGEGDSADINLKFIPKGVGWFIFDGTGAVLVPDGTTGERPGTPANGMVRYNTTTSLMETYEGGAWTPLVGASTSHASTHVPGAADILPDLNFFNGTFLETMDAVVTSDGATVTMTIEQSGGGDLTMKFSDGRTTFDCTPAASIALTPGTDTSPQGNFVYILQSAKILAKSTSDWPSEEHIKIAYFLVPTASLVNTGAAGNNFVYVNHNWNDHSAGTDDQGHLSHLTERSRQLGAQWRNGCQGTATQDGNDLWVSVASGTVYQMHRHAFAALDSDTDGAGDTILVVNDPDAAYTIINSLNSITKHSNGDLIGNNKYVKFVLWGVVNKSGEVSSMMLNLPAEHYNTQDDAAADVDGVSNFSIPTEFQEESTTGFLIAAFVCKHTASAMEIQETIDLRGQITATATGAGTGGGDVSAAASLTDHAIVRGDGGAKDVQTSTATISDAGVMSVPGGVNTIELANTGGDLKIEPDAEGNVTLFEDTDVADAAAGKSLYIHRKAVEGDTSLRLYVSNDQEVILDSTSDLVLISGVGKVLWLLSGDDVILGLGDDAGADKVEIQDVNLNVVGAWDSDGNITLAGAVTALNANSSLNLRKTGTGKVKVNNSGSDEQVATIGESHIDLVSSAMEFAF